MASSVPSKTERRNLHLCERTLLAEAAPREQFEAILAFARTVAQGLELHEVERGLFQRLLELGRALLVETVAEKGTGREQAGSAIRTDDGAKVPYHSTKTRSYLSIFGEVSIPRAYYWQAGARGVCPLDGEWNLPEQRYSYLLQEWGELLAVDGSFERATERLDAFLGLKFWTQGVQKVARSAAVEVQGFYEEKGPPSPESEGELLVATIDGKGVPIRPEERRGRKLRLKAGEKPNKKKEAVVSAVYTVDRHHRTAADVIREVDSENRVIAPDHAPSPRPKPRSKRLRATMRGKEEAFAEVRRQLEERDPQGEMERIALTDGAEALQTRVLTELGGKSGIVLILDIVHVLGYLWGASHAHHQEGTPGASRWVMNKLRLLLEGKVGYVIGSLKRRLGEGDLGRSKACEVEKAIQYMERNRAFMEYDRYLARGYPIASGVVEGACKHLVKDRMECTGMRWNIDGAQAMLELRATELNGDWRDFWSYYARRQADRLYGAHRGCSRAGKAA